jgi:hypothetical protein
MDVSKVPWLAALADENSRLRRRLLNAMLDVYTPPGCLAEKSRQIEETHSEPHKKKEVTGNLSPPFYVFS